MSEYTQDYEYCNCRILNDPYVKIMRFIMLKEIDDRYHRVVREDLNTRLQYWIYNESTL